MTVVREDLLALSPEAVAALANLGLVKRAQREIGEGNGPQLAIEEDGTVVGSFGEGGARVVARLVPKKALRDCPCTCGAPTVCRHRVATALAYPAWAKARGDDASSTEGAAWDPGRIDDAALAKFLGKRMFDRARTALRGGLVVVVVPWAEQQQAPTAKLPSCTVRFHVPNDLAYARCDCVTGSGCEHIAIAVWAFRRASEDGPLLGARPVSLGDASKDETSAATTTTGLDEAAALVNELLQVGVSNVPVHFAERFARVRAALESQRVVWPLDAVEDLERLTEAYRARSARYDERRAAELAIELVARSRSVARVSELPPRFVLGEGQARETLLDHVRLVAVGARIATDGDARIAEVFLADPDSGDVLVFEKEWLATDADAALTGLDLARRAALPGVPLETLSRGQIVTRAASRRANGLVTFGRGRAQTSVTLQSGEWGTLPAPLLARDFGALESHLRSLAPRMLRPRILAEGFHVLEIATVEEVAYLAAEQRVVVIVRDAAGTPLRLERTHATITPHVVDAVASAAESGLLFAAGPVRRTSRGLVLEPLALVTGAGGDDRHQAVTVPDLARAPSIHHAKRTMERSRTDDLGAALERAELLVTEAVHVGLARLPSTYRARLDAGAKLLDNMGLESQARAASNFAEALGTARAPSRFFDLAILVELSRELA